MNLFKSLRAQSTKVTNADFEVSQDDKNAFEELGTTLEDKKFSKTVLILLALGRYPRSMLHALGLTLKREARGSFLEPKACITMFTPFSAKIFSQVSQVSQVSSVSQVSQVDNKWTVKKLADIGPLLLSIHKEFNQVEVFEISGPASCLRNEHLCTPADDPRDFEIVLERKGRSPAGGRDVHAEERCQWWPMKSPEDIATVKDKVPHLKSLLGTKDVKVAIWIAVYSTWKWEGSERTKEHIGDKFSERATRYLPQLVILKATGERIVTENNKSTVPAQSLGHSTAASNFIPTKRFDKLSYTVLKK